MFCKNCGSTIDDNAVVCPNCGVQVKELASSEKSNSSNSNTIAIVGFVLSFFFALIGLICSIIGYRKAANEGAPHKGLALAGIIISAASMVLAVILYVTVIGAALSAAAGMVLLA